MAATTPGLATLRDAMTHALTATLDLLMPPLCPACKAPTQVPNRFCADCFSSLPAIPEPACSRCGVPLPAHAGGATECLSCLKDPPPWRSARAPFAYDAAARAAVVRFKNGREEMAPLLAGFLLPIVPEVPSLLLVPVPLHRSRLMSRGYNQSAHLARALARAASLPLLVDGLVRTRATRSSQGLSRTGRARNVAGAFAIPERHRPALAGQPILLIDDVLTTGATAAAATRALLRGGATEVHVLTFARVAPSIVQHYGPMTSEPRPS
jgi:ComF family protein